MAKCLQCGVGFAGKRSTARYCSAKCRKLAFLSVPVSVPENGKEVSVPDTVSVLPEIPLSEIPGVKPLGLPLTPTGSTCSSFAELPKGVRVDINSLAVWCKAKGIWFDGDAQVSRAIHYERFVRSG